MFITFLPSLIHFKHCLPHFFNKKVHRGNLKEYIKNIENKKASTEDANKKQQHLNNGCHNASQIIAKSLKSPKLEVVGDSDELSTIFKKFDSKYKTDSEKESAYNNDADDGDYDSGGAQEQKTPPSQDSPNTEDSPSSVPKPMPRTSRNNSLQDSNQQQLGQDAPSILPKPRPRTSAGAYKVCPFVVTVISTFYVRFLFTILLMLWLLLLYFFKI